MREGRKKKGKSAEPEAPSEDQEASAETEDVVELGPDEPRDGLAGDVDITVFSCPVDHQGNTVHVKGWVKSGTERPPLIFVHDLGEHIGLYRPAARELVAAGYSVYGFDLRGHGLSGPTLGHIPNFNTLVNDLLQVVAWIRFKSMRKVPILIGQGIGALIAVYFQRAYPKLCPGAVLAAPYLSVNAYTSTLKRFIIRTLAETAPRIRLPAAMTPAFMSHYATSHGTQDATHPQPFHGITANFANELLRAINRAPDEFARFDCPTLILCPERDPFCDYSRLRELVEAHPQRAGISIESLPDAGHHLLTEEESALAQALSHIVPWLNHVETPP